MLLLGHLLKLILNCFMLTFKSGEHFCAWSLSFWVHILSKLFGVSWIVFPDDLLILLLFLNQFFITLGSRPKVDRYFVSSSVRYSVFSKCSWSFKRWYSSKRILLPLITVTRPLHYLKIDFKKSIQKGSCSQNMYLHFTVGGHISLPIYIAFFGNFKVLNKIKIVLLIT